MALLDNPDQLALLLSGASSVALCVEECLRFDGPTPSMVRIRLNEIPVGGNVIKHGERVVALLGSANRDAAVLKDPDRFDMTRLPNAHVTSG
jgi:cytochrome P450